MWKCRLDEVCSNVLQTIRDWVTIVEADEVRPGRLDVCFGWGIGFALKETSNSVSAIAATFSCQPCYITRL